jgi:diguanylate cyclase (GGDEF)-like protein
LSVRAAATALRATIGAIRAVRDVRGLADTRRHATTDDLTGLANRRHFYERLTTLLANRVPGQTLALLLVDLNRFKEVNDALGHHVGDQLLAQIGPRLRRVLRSDDLVGRLGGDEFAVLLPGAGVALATSVAARITSAFEDPFQLDGASLHVDASVGIALVPEHATDGDTLLQRADVAMYQSKRTNGGWKVYEAHEDPRSRHRLETFEQLRSAIALNQLVVHYQPKVALPSGTPVGVEALVRWNHPDRGLLYPDAFVALAEQTGLMRPLTLAVLDMALGQCRAWRDEGLALTMAVNLSASSLLDTRLYHDVVSVLDLWSLSPSVLELEITEHVLMADPARAQDVIGALRGLGIVVSLDDYGTGFSSLSYLRQLTVDELKLDRLFVSDLSSGPGAKAIVRSTADLAHALGLHIVAEGVETEGELDVVTRLGYDLAQGYHLSRPKPAAELTHWLRQRLGAPPSPSPESSTTVPPDGGGGPAALVRAVPSPGRVG